MSRKYAVAVVARVKGALREGFSHKVLSVHSGISAHTIAQWATGKNHRDIEPERFPVELLENWLKCK